MENLILHNRTKLVMEGLVSDTPNAIIITGPSGSGKKYIANQLVNQIVSAGGIGPRKVNQHKLMVTPNDKGVITIDQVRQLYSDTQHHYSSKKIVIITDAHSMNREAQNAFLKLLEEPPRNVHFIMTSISLGSLLPTITSRAQELPVVSLNKTTLEDSLTKRYHSISSDRINATILQSDMRLGRIIRSLDDGDSKYVDSMAVAKQLLQAPIGERMILIQAHFNDSRSQILSILDSMIIISKYAMESSVRKGNQQQTSSWIDRISVIETAAKNIRSNGNIKIQLLNCLSRL